MNKIQVSEEKILEAIDLSTVVDGVPAEHLVQVIDKGKIIQKNGLTPFYIFDMDDGSILVTSEENMERKLH